MRRWKWDFRRRANMEHVRQSRPNFGFGFQVKLLIFFEGVPSSLGLWMCFEHREDSRCPLLDHGRWLGTFTQPSGILVDYSQTLTSSISVNGCIFVVIGRRLIRALTKFEGPMFLETKLVLIKFSQNKISPHQMFWTRTSSMSISATVLTFNRFWWLCGAILV